jgi:hypothetical protein
MRDIKSREDAITTKEESLSKTENMLKEKEQQLLTLENKLAKQAQELQEKEKTLNTLQQQLKEQQQTNNQQAMQLATVHKRRHSVDRVSVGGDNMMMCIDDELPFLQQQMMCGNGTPMMMNNQTPSDAFTNQKASNQQDAAVRLDLSDNHHLSIPPLPSSNDEEEGKKYQNRGGSSSNSQEEQTLAFPLPPSSESSQQPTIAIKASRAYQSSINSATTTSNASISSSAINYANNFLNDRKRGPVPLPGGGIGFQIYDENIPSSNNGSNVINHRGVNNNPKLQDITSKTYQQSNQQLASEKENANPNSKLFRLRANNGAVNTKVTSVGEQRRSFPNNYLFDNNSADISPLKKARYQIPNSNNGVAFATTVQLDLDTLLRPRQLK